MKPREYLLWFLFLVVCFGAGFIRGHLPPSRIRYVLGAPEEIRILTVSKKLLPNKFIALLEKETHSKIEVTEFATWEKSESQIVSNNTGFHLIIGPSHWAQELSRRGTLTPFTSSFQTDISNNIHPDFLLNGEPSQFFLPIGWILTEFASTSPIEKLPLQVALSNKENRIHLLYDPDLIREKFEVWESITKKIQRSDKFSTSDLETVLPLNSSNREIFEIEHLTASNSSNEQKGADQVWHFNRDWPGRSLMVYGVMIPKSTPDRSSSQMIAREWLRRDRTLLYAQEAPVASTLSELDNSALVREKKPRHLRDLNLVGVVKTKNIDSTQFRELKQKYGIISPE